MSAEFRSLCLALAMTRFGAVQDYLFRVLFSLLIAGRALCAPPRSSARPVRVRSITDIDWTREGVSTHTASDPLYVSWQSVLKFQCEKTDSTSFVYLLRPEEYENISSDCERSDIVSVGTDSLCRPPAIADCRRDSLEYWVQGATATESSCTVAGFRPDRLYYLANFPRNDTERCLFALPLRVCAEDATDCPPLPPTPSPSTLPTLSSSPPTLGPPPGRDSSSTTLYSPPSATVVPSPSPSPSPSLSPSVSPSLSPSVSPTSSAARHYSGLLTMCLSILFISLCNKHTF